MERQPPDSTKLKELYMLYPIRSSMVIVTRPRPMSYNLKLFSPVEFSSEEIENIKNQIQPNTILGEGNYGVVHKGRIPVNNGRGLAIIDVAVKQPRITQVISPELIEQWQVERTLLSAINHENIINLVGYSNQNNGLCLVYELMPLRDLETKLPSLDWSNTLKILRGIASAIAYLHERDPEILYRDLKCTNILLDRDYKPKLSDFGLAKQGALGWNYGGTHGASDPKLTRGRGTITRAVDVWSMGMLIMTLITKKATCLRKRSLELHALITRGEKDYQGMRSMVKAGLREAWIGNFFTGDIIHEHIIETGCTEITARKLLKLAVKCTRKKSSRRPNIQQVRNIIDDIPVPVEEAA